MTEFDRELFESVFERRSHAALAPDWDDLQFLWKFCVSRKIRTVVEYGSGCSTAVFAHALQTIAENGFCWSVESSPQWSKETMAMLLSNWHHRVHIVIADAPVVEVMGRKAYEYQWYPPIVPDLIYIDGPELIHADVTINPVECPAQFVIVDGRSKTVDFYRQTLCPFYRLEQNHDRSIFERKTISQSGNA